MSGIGADRTLAKAFSMKKNTIIRKDNSPSPVSFPFPLSMGLVESPEEEEALHDFGVCPLTDTDEENENDDQGGDDDDDGVDGEGGGDIDELLEWVIKTTRTLAKRRQEEEGGKEDGEDVGLKEKGKRM